MADRSGIEWTEATWNPTAGCDRVIAGGESGAGARPMELDWVTELRDACISASVAFFFEPWGGRTPKAGGRELEGKL